MVIFWSGGGGLLHFPLNSNTKRVQRLQMQQQNQEEMKEDDGHATSTRRRQFILQAPLIAFSFPQLIMSTAIAVAEIGNPVHYFTCFFFQS